MYVLVGPAWLQQAPALLPSVLMTCAKLAAIRTGAVAQAPCESQAEHNQGTSQSALMPPNFLQYQFADLFNDGFSSVCSFLGQQNHLRAFDCVVCCLNFMHIQSMPLCGTCNQPLRLARACKERLSHASVSQSG